MKVHIDIDCTPEEARTFFGLPDLQPMQEAVMKEMQDRMTAAMRSMDPETLMKTWLPAGIANLEQMQKACLAAIRRPTPRRIRAKERSRHVRPQEAGRSRALLRGARVLLRQRAAGGPSARLLQEASGSEKLRNYMKARAKELGLDGVRINQALCLDRCELGPTMVIYPEQVWYTYRTIEDAEEILQKHIIKGERVERLMLQPEDKVPEDLER